MPRTHFVTESAVLEQYMRRLNQRNSFSIHGERVNSTNGIFCSAMFTTPFRAFDRERCPAAHGTFTALSSGYQPGATPPDRQHVRSVRGSVRPRRPVARARRGIRLRGRGGGRRGRGLHLQRGTDEQRSNQDGDREHERALHAEEASHMACHAPDAIPRHREYSRSSSRVANGGGAASAFDRGPDVEERQYLRAGSAKSRVSLR